ncbi:MAG: cysteine dioxygenase family protein [Vicingaceae bacterium]
MDQEITTINQLIANLNGCDEEGYKKIVSRINIPLTEYSPYVFWEESSYTRNCIHRTKDYELILLCWDEGEETAIHCHNNQECWVYVLKGEFQEERFQETERGLKIEQELDLMKEGVSYMNDDMGYHRLANSEKSRGMSLHLYMNPIDECNIYNAELDQFELKPLKYDSFKGEPVKEEVH